jgi:hypothetical protein
MPRFPAEGYLRGLDTVRLRKDDLIAAIRGNRDGHRAAFLQAQQGWHTIVLEELERRLADARAGRKVNTIFSYPEPVDHTRDYDRVLRILDMSLDPELELSQQDFAKYVMDDWEWKAQWTQSTVAYAAAAPK